MKAVTTVMGLTAIIGIVGLATVKARASDHADTQEVVNRPGSDISDVFVFPSPENPDNVVFVMNVRPLIGQGQSASVEFDTDVLYQFKIDLNQDGKEDRVIQVMFEGSGPNQVVKVAGPKVPGSVGTVNNALAMDPVTGITGEAFWSSNQIHVFAGPREDPFFFDLEQFFTILPDRGVPSGLTSPPMDPNQPMATSWRDPGDAVDFLSNGGFNVLSIVVEMPKSKLVNL
ncbi:MAG: DUF4331 family protein [Fimbriimonadaceae bacterium]|nr:DUF4331 family protein [Fimbriimonadaceae bacterium]